MKAIVELITVILLCAGMTTSTCTDGICEAMSQGEKGLIMRADDGDVFIPINPNSNYNCSNHIALCIGDNCEACRCKKSQDTWKDSHNSCKNINNGFYEFSREGLDIDTHISTVYFVLNGYFKYELQSTATGTSLPIVKKANGAQLESSCNVNGLHVMTTSGLMELDDSGFGLVTVDGKRYVEITPSQLKIQPQNLQGKLLQLNLKCGTKKRFLYFKVQGKSAIIDNSCLNCQGNFKYLEYLAVPEFQIPTTNDMTLHFSQNTLQMSGSDVAGCNGDTNNMFNYRNESDTCSLLQLPSTNLIYATQNKIQGRNLNPQDQSNAIIWESMTNKVINITVNCQGNKRFCVLFKMTNSTSSCSSGNPCLNGGVWTDKGIGSCTCVCPSGYSGVLCTTYNDHCLSNPCCNGATCSIDSSSYQCTCPPGKTGSTCCDDINYCEGNPCCNGATCISNSSLLTHQCTCPPGKTGSTCCDDIDYCESDPCCNGASCTSNSSLLTHQCTCPPGKTGSTCCDDINYCEGNPCCNGATCTSDSSLLTHQCTCPPGKTGSTCCDDIDYCASDPCCNGASCTSNSSLLTHQCTCPPGKTGSTCCDDIDYCASDPCCNGATCTSDSSLLTHKCTCPPGKTGPTCCDDIDYCESNPCCSGATCTSDSSLLTHQCTCPPGKTGPICCDHIDYCESNPCCNGATCTSDSSLLEHKCTCPPGKTGSTCCDNIDYCESNPCCSGATCTSNSSSLLHQCTCPPGKTGPICCDDIEYCKTDTCCRGGRCVVDNFSAKCECSEGYTGDRCCDTVDDGEECSSDTCANGGTCVEVEGQITCSCPSEHTGPHCETPITDIPFGEAAARPDGENSFPIIPVSAAVTIALVALVATVVLTTIFCQKVYLPWRRRTRLRKANTIDPFKTAGTHQIYNPMYVDEDAAIYSDKSLTLTSTSLNQIDSENSPDIKQLDNPLYHKEDRTEGPTIKEEDHIYETCASTSLSSPQIAATPGFTLNNPYDTLETSDVFKLHNPYDTLESSVGSDQLLISNRYSATDHDSDDYSTIDDDDIDPVYESVDNLN